ncbi:ABC transporter ATP-binding protein [Marinicrinis sediminis]|uniref:ABC transporter ATP-binding protein n=1 Tax=Marinicrinis sediminis TaxID=1652465 RepID=A0ABW5RAU5_9BACL
MQAHEKIHHPQIQTPIIQMEAVSKTYSGRKAYQALDNVNLSIDRESFTMIMGASGSGKSTLLNCAAGLDRPTSGSIIIQDVAIHQLKEPRLTKFRRQHIGFIFQSFNLVQALTVWHNVLLPQKLAGRRPNKQVAVELLKRTGLYDIRHKMPYELSGGQQQRAAIVRALASGADMVYADEPTGALDLRTGKEILTMLRETTVREGKTVLMVTHDVNAAAYADRVIILADGRVQEDLRHPSAQQVASTMMEVTQP